MISEEEIRKNYQQMVSDYANCPEAIRPSSYWEDRLLWDNDRDVHAKDLASFRHQNLIMKNLPDSTQSCLGRMRSWFFIRNRYRKLKKEFPNSAIDQFEEDDIGKPCFIRYRGKKMTYRFVRFFHHLEVLRSHTRMSDRERLLVVEIGSGYAGFAKIFKKIFPNSTYVVLDLPELLVLSTYYLTRNFPEAKFCFYDKQRGGKNFSRDELMKHDFAVLPQWSINRIPDQSVDLYINHCSFQEMKPESVSFYFEAIQRQSRKYLFLVNRIAKSFGTNLKKARAAEDTTIRFDDYPFDQRWRVLLKRECPFYDIDYGGPIFYPKHPPILELVAERIVSG